MNICYYITSHGFGHATRSFAVIKELLKKDFNVIIRANLPDWLIKNSFKEEKLKYQSQFKTLEVYHDSTSLELQYDQSIQYLMDYCKNYSSIIKQEVKFCKKKAVDLIISDIEPSAFEIADECGIKSFAITNFTWYDIYDAILPKDSTILRRFKRAYSKAELLFRLPFHFEMPVFNETIDVPLVFRRLTRNNAQVKSFLGISSTENLIFIQFGGHISNQFKHLFQKLYDYHVQHPETIFLINRFSKMPTTGYNTSFIKHIPAEDAEIQDYVAACDLLVGKTGYSLVSEIVGFGTPFFYTIRDRWKEDEILKRGIENHGIGKFYTRLQMSDGIWIEEIQEGVKLRQNHPKNPIEKYGQNIIADYIMNYKEI